MGKADEQTILATADGSALVKPDAPEEWGKREEITALANRFKVMLPGGNRLDDNQLMAAAQYSVAMGLNPFRGEVYFYKGRGGQLVIVDGYKSLARWARDKAPYSDKYEPIGVEGDEVHKYRCWILRDDRRDMMKDFIELGATFREAFELTASAAVGVVTKDDMTTNSGAPNKPPTGWTWDQVARKRAMKNALNISHGAPSIKELAKKSWEIDPPDAQAVKTIAQDWDGLDDYPPGEREGWAYRRARLREMRAEREQTGDHVDLDELNNTLFDAPMPTQPAAVDSDIIDGEINEPDPEPAAKPQPRQKVTPRIDLEQLPENLQFIAELAENPDLETLTFKDGSFQEAACADLGFSNAFHITGALKKRLGKNWVGIGLNATQIWTVLEFHQSEKAKDEEE